MNYLEIGEFQNRFKENLNKTLLSTIDYGNLTYGQVWSNAEHICKIWKKTGAKSGDCIAFILNNNPSLLVSYIACAIGGFVANPINPTLNIKIIDSIIKLTKPKITLRNPPQLNKNINIVKENEIKITTNPDSSFFILSTSGTTGEPKGICHSLSSIMGSARDFAALSFMNKKTFMYHVLPMYYMAGFLNTFFAPILAGGRVIEGPQFSQSTMFGFWDHCIEKQANTLCLTPTIVSSLCYMARDKEKAKKNASGLISIHSTAGVLHKGIRQRFYKLFGKPLQDCYGLTELGGPLTIQTSVDSLTEHNSGRPMPSLTFSFRKNLTGDVEMWLKSPNIMKGYVSKDGMDLPIDDKGFMPTGDIAELKDGNLSITGRVKDVIIKGSENIYPFIIENEISPLDGVREVAVVGAVHEFWGEMIVGCIIPEQNIHHLVLIKKLQKYCLQNLPASHQPDKWIFFKDFPRTVTGKIKKRLLIKQLSVNQFEKMNLIGE